MTADRRRPTAIFFRDRPSAVYLGENTMSKTTIIAEPGKQEVVITRTFDAPRELVFNMYIDPKRIPQWWGPEGITTIVDKMDARPGGSWRFVQRDENGNEYGFHGVYHDITQPERVVNTFEFEGIPGHVCLETVTFEEHKGKTTLKNLSVFQTLEDRDGMVMSGMEEGADDSMNRFAALLAND
jgi:uncharacterized protein YndB with AHSA1/START domain